MRRNKIVIAFIWLTIFLIGNTDLYGQQIVNHHVDFNTTGQNMWGPSWSPFTIDQEITIFEQGWNESYNTGNSMIFTVAGQSFGASLQGSFSGLIGSKISLNGFTTGTVDVDYPIDVVLDMSTDLTYDPGDVVTVQTSYTVDPTAELKTFYPSVGEAKWDLYFQMAASTSATLCAFGCTTFPIIPAFNTGLVTLNLVTANASGISYLCPTPPSFSCNYPLFPYEFPDNDYGISGEVTIPYVETDSYISGNNLNACGDSTYFNLNLEIFQLIGGLNIPYVSAVAGNLSGSESLGPAEVYWNFFSASFDANITNKQCFDFSPKIYGEFVFPVAVDYWIIEPSNGSTISTGTSSIVNIEIGKNFNYKFPCYFETVNIVPTYSIIGQLTNHTWDSISFDFLMSAFQFGFIIPAIEVVPEIYVPEVCIPYGYPCGSVFWPDWCTGEACTPSFTIPAIGFSGLSFNYGPAWSMTIPIGSIEYDWFNQTWDLEGFSDSTFIPFTMNARRLLASAVGTNVSCYGGNDGTINVSLTNAALPASYTWTNGANTEDLTGLAAGPYEVSVIDANGCQLFTGATILEPQQPLSLSATVTDKSCNGGVNNGSIDATVIGGTAPYTYNWTNGATSEDISGLNVGTYSLTVTDFRGCTAVISGTIQQPAVLGQVAAITHVNCFGGASGTIAVDVFGGVLPYSFSWNSGQTTEDIATIPAGNYILNITDGNGCNSNQSYSVLQPAAPLSLSSTAVNVDCKDNWTGSIDVTTNGGTAGYSYVWSNSQGFVLPYQTEDLANIPAEVFTVIVTDTKGCQFTLSQSVTEPIASISSTPTLTHINCFGDATGAIISGIAGGTAPYTYAWSNGATSANISSVTSGSYTLTVTDFNNCQATYSYTLNQPTNSLVVTLSGTNILCFGNSTGAVSSTTTGGTTPYTCLWSNGSTAAAINNLIAGTYSVTVTDNLGCIATNSIVLTEPLAPLAASTVVTDVDCHGSNSGEIDLSVSGGTVPYSYVWSNGQSLILTEITQDLTTQYANSYTVWITDNNGCQETVTSIISQPGAPLFTSGIINDVNCFGLNDGAIDASISGGTIPYSFAWSNGAVTEDVSNVVAGNYTLTVTDNLGCTLSNNFTIVEPNAALSIATFVKDVICNAGTTGGIDAVISGGTAPYTYLWSNGATTLNIDQVSAGPYSLTVTDAQGCIAFTGAVVNQPVQALTVVPAVVDASCYGYADGQITLSISGGTQPYYFNWGNQNEILLNNNSEVLSGLATNDYFIRIRDKNGCIVEQTITVGEPTPFLGTTIVSDVTCFGGNDGSIDLTISGSTPAYSIVWSDGQLTEDAINLTEGTYEYVVTDNQGCVLRNQVIVTEPEELKISTQLYPVSCIDQTDASIFINTFGGTMPYTYNWSNGQITQNIENLAPGNYSVTISDNNSCVSTFNFVIDISEQACLDIPNTITPNGDNYNDTWILENLDLYPYAQVKIFNKWGNLIFSSDGVYTPWEGTYNGEPLPSEVYYYIIELKNSLEDKYTGTITIIR